MQILPDQRRRALGSRTHPRWRFQGRGAAWILSVDDSSKAVALLYPVPLKPQRDQCQYPCEASNERQHLNIVFQLRWVNAELLRPDTSVNCQCIKTLVASTVVSRPVNSLEIMAAKA